MMLCIMTMAPASFAGLAPSEFLKMVAPILGLIWLGVVGVAIFAMIAGKLVK